MRALQTAATGMMAQELNVQVISNNIANLRTTGYKRQQAHFQDLLYENFSPSRLEHVRPEHAGTRRRRARLRREDRLDGPRNGSGKSDRDREGIRRRHPRRRLLPKSACLTAAPPTPATAPSISTSQGQIVTRDGYLLDPASPCRRMPKRCRSAPPAQSRRASPGRRSRRRSARSSSHASSTKSGLESIGDNLFLETAASGPAIDGNPGIGRFRQPSAELSRGGERQRGHRDLVADRRAARLRDELRASSRRPTRCCPPPHKCSAAEETLNDDPALRVSHPRTNRRPASPRPCCCAWRSRIAAFSMAIVPVFAGESPVLRGDIAARADVLTLGDLVEGLRRSCGDATPVFRAPALGETRARSRRSASLDAARALGITRIETDGRAEVRVTRAARRIGRGRDRGCIEADAGDRRRASIRAPFHSCSRELPPFSSRPISRRP